MAHPLALVREPQLQAVTMWQGLHLKPMLYQQLVGAFSFILSLATTNIITAGFNVYDDPTENTYNFTSSKEEIVAVQVVDMLSKVVATSSNATVDAAALNTGVYYTKVTSAIATTTVKKVKD